MLLCLAQSILVIQAQPHIWVCLSIPLINHTIRVNHFHGMTTLLKTTHIISTFNTSLRVSSLGQSGGRGEKEGELATASLEFEYLHWKSWCKMLIGRDDIANDNHSLAWHMFFNVCLHPCSFLLLCWLADIWQLSRCGATGELEVEFKFQNAPERLLAG